MIARDAAIAISAARLSVRDEVQDPSIDPAGNTIPIAIRRYSDAQIDASLNRSFAKLGAEMAGTWPQESLLFSDVELAGGALEVALPVEIGPGAIYVVYDATNTANLLAIDYVPELEIEAHGQSDSWQRQRRRYTLVANPDYPADEEEDPVSPYLIKIRPKATGARTLRIGYLAAPLVTDNEDDVHPFLSQWQELIVLDAADRLMSRSGQTTAAQERRYSQLWDQFIHFCRRQRGPRRVRRTRRSLS